jgi:uncharacterized protein YyaL (SSP411 family)
MAMVEQTLAAMRSGGIFDQIGFGFHRYSTDPAWLVPHFEKMLYDQALLTMAYTEAYQATGKTEYVQTVRQILEYVSRDMTSPEGAFWSAEDADSEREEGKFYLWSLADVQSLLNETDAELISRVYNLRPEGNYVEQGRQRLTGSNIPHMLESVPAIANEMRISPPVLEKRLDTIRRTLFAAREKRVHPHKDDKTLTDWNGLMIAAYAKAAQALDDTSYVNSARRAADFILNTLRRPDGRLLHRFRQGDSALPAHVDDYAFMVWGLLELYEASFDLHYLRVAVELNDDMIRHFWDAERGGFFFTADDGEQLLVRQKESYDGAVPSGNSVAMLNLARLGRITGQSELLDKATSMGRVFSANLWGNPASYCQMLQAVDFLIGPTNEVVICGEPGDPETKTMLRAIREAFLPNKIVLFKPSLNTRHRW